MLSNKTILDPLSSFDFCLTEDAQAGLLIKPTIQPAFAKKRIPFPQISRTPNFSPTSSFDCCSDLSFDNPNDIISDVQSLPINKVSNNVGNEVKSCITNIDITQNVLNVKNSKIDIKNKARRKRVPFLPEEDDKLKQLVGQFGMGNWSLISNFMFGRTPKQCRDRYCNYLIPGFFKGEWSNEEDELLVKLYYQFGPKWSLLKQSFPGRSPNSLKNRWNYFLSYRQNEFINSIQSSQINNNLDNIKKINISSFDTDKNAYKYNDTNDDRSFNEDLDDIVNNIQSNQKKEDEILQLIDHESEIFELINNSMMENESEWFLIN